MKDKKGDPDGKLIIVASMYFPPMYGGRLFIFPHECSSDRLMVLNGKTKSAFK